MKKSAVYFAVVLLSFVLLAGIVLGESQKKITASCKAECSNISRNEAKTCKSDYKACNKECADDNKACLNATQERYSDCKGLCITRWCIRDCSNTRINEREECSKRECTLSCRNDLSNCTQESKTNFFSCKDICEKSPFEISKEECENASGLFYRVCNGPYFDIVCSQKSYCICDGKSNNTCPQNYTCNHDIEELTPRKTHTIEGYKDLSGNDLGDIGVCKKA